MSDAQRDLFVSVGMDVGSALRGLGDLNRQVDSTKRNLGGMGAPIGQGVASFETQMSNLDKNFNLWERNAGQFTTTMERKQRRIDLVTDQTALLEREIASTRGELANATTQFGAGSEAAGRLENQLLDLQIQQADYNRELKSLTTFDWSALDRIGDRFTDIGKAMTLGVTTPLMAIGGLGLRTFVQLEDSWAGVEKVTSGTSDELENLRQQMHDLVTVDRIPLSVTEMYGIAQAAGRLGIATENVIGFSETVAMLGTVTNMTSEQAATDMAQFATVMQMPQEQFDRLGATLVGLGNNMAATESDIMRMGARLTGAGNAIGLAEADVLGFAAAFSALGINAEAGGTAFTNIMLAMNDSVMGGGEHLEIYASVAGKCVADFVDLFQRDAASAIVYFVEGLGHLQDSGENLNDIFSSLDKNGANITDLLRRGAGAGDTLRNSIELANTSWEENSALVDAAGKRYNTTAAQIQVFRNNLTLLSNQIGTELADRFGNILSIGTRFLEWLGNLDEGTRSTVITIGLVVAAIGPVLLGIGYAIKMVNKMRQTVLTMGRGIVAFKNYAIKGGKAVAGLTVKIGKSAVAFGAKTVAMTKTSAAFVAGKAKIAAYGVAATAVKGKNLALAGAAKVMTAAQWLLNKAMLANLIGLVIAAIGALIAIGILLWRNWDTVKEKARMLWDNMKNIFGNIRDFVVNIVSNVAEFISERFPAAFGFITGHLRILKDTFMSIFEGVKQVFRGLIDFVVGIFTGDWGRAWEGVRDVFSGIFSTLGSILKAPINMIINMINAVINGINGINISVPGWVPGIGGRELGFNIPNIPMLAKGTDNHIGGPAIVGEKGPELVILPKGASVTPADKTKDILNGLGKLKPTPTPDVGGLSKIFKRTHTAEGKPIPKKDKTKPSPIFTPMMPHKPLGYKNREEKPDSFNIRKYADEGNNSGGANSKIASLVNKVEVTIQRLVIEGGGEMTEQKINDLKKLIKEVFKESWEDAWYDLMLKYPNLTAA